MPSPKEPKKEAVQTSVVQPLGPYSVAVRSGGFVFLAGQVGWDYESQRLVDGGVEAEAHQALGNVGSVLEDCGLGFGDVVRGVVYLTDLADWPKLNEIWGSCFTHLPPARSAVGVAGLPAGACVEIEVTAAER
ncbi:MAG: reactive intermediate/imine deaminase [Acidimicrobiia bacterium]|nr:reactive intermediate/imine deaminase [Acidimicrobiia bacterium]